jgi:5'-methylthioadenosine phosphorylase
VTTEAALDRPVARIGIIRGSGFQQLLGLSETTTVECETAFGKPSSPITLGWLDGVPVAFL